MSGQGREAVYVGAAFLLALGAVTDPNTMLNLVALVVFVALVWSAIVHWIIR